LDNEATSVIFTFQIMVDYLSYTETPVIEIREPFLDTAGVRLLVKLEYLNHPTVSGNKWWKLKHNLLEVKKISHRVLTFGGAYSNHIYAAAAATSAMGIPSVGIIRGEDSVPRNPTLSFAEKKGMRLKFIQRSAYRLKSDPAFVDELRKEFGDFMLIPEGGTNCLALKGTMEFGSLLRNIEADVIVTPVGTGGTIAGLSLAMPEKKIIGVSSLKNGGFLEDDVRSLQSSCCNHVTGNFSIITDYHFGGYAKVKGELLDFIRRTNKVHDLPLDPIYTGKMMFAIYDLVHRGNFQKGTTILALHTGGLQGSSSIITL
jgi:1-aminocyclopropane-1-carboxylate deaminase